MAMTACGLVMAFASLAQNFPARVVRIVVPFVAGGNTDFTGRTISAKLTEALGQQFIVDNRPGGYTNIGADMVVRSAPDGYTLLLSSGANVAINTAIFWHALRAHGINVVKLGTFDMLDMFDHAKIQPEEIYRKVKEITTPKSEAVFVACTQLRALEVLDMLERDLGKPVYSAVQASAWQAYAAMNVDPKIMNCGSLLRKLSEPEAQKAAARLLHSA